MSSFTLRANVYADSAEKPSNGVLLAPSPTNKGALLFAWMPAFKLNFLQKCRKCAPVDADLWCLYGSNWTLIFSFAFFNVLNKPVKRRSYKIIDQWVQKEQFYIIALLLLLNVIITHPSRFGDVHILISFNLVKKSSCCNMIKNYAKSMTQL